MSKQRVCVASRIFEMSRDSSTSIVSSICTPTRRITPSSIRRIANDKMTPFPMPNIRKSSKKLSKNSAQEHDSLSTAKKDIDTEAYSSVQSIGKKRGKKSQRSESQSTISMENDQSVLNKTFDMELDDQENVQDVIGKARSNKKTNPKARVSIIDLTESPVVENSNVSMAVAHFHKTEDENTISVNGAIFSEDDDQEDIPTKDKTFSPKLAPSQISLKLKRLQPITPMKKAISMAKTVKIAEVAEPLVKEITQTNSLNLPLMKTGRSEQVKSTPFRFGLTQNGRGFNFNLKGTKIPTLNLKKKEGEFEENTDKSVTKSKVKLMPNFKAIHERIFEKDLPIDEIENHKIKRAKLIKSGIKLSTEENIFKPIQPKSKRKLEMNIIQPKIEQRKPLSNVNSRAKLNSEQREERRKMMFKQGPMGRQSKRISEKVIIKGVRTNRRFDLMMEQRFK